MWNFPLFPDQAAETAWEVDAIAFYEFAIAAFFTALIFFFIVGLAIRYRRGARVGRAHPPLHSRAMEVLWIGVPLLLELVMFIWATLLFHRMYEPPYDAMEVYVVGKQWMWKTQHVEGRAEINELHVPAGQAIKLTMTSEDVIHSFYIPAFRVKQDVLPGRYTTMWFRPTKVGRYHLFCAEYCGTSHSGMIGTVEVMEPADFQEWLTRLGPGPSLAEEGEKLFVQHHCAGCHRGSQVVNAPWLEGIYGRSVPIQRGNDVTFTRADERYLRDSILDPKKEVVAGYQPLMPSFKDVISEQDLLKIIAYIKSIGSKEVPR
jgi:cytochrome c oxidase subunit II